MTSVSEPQLSVLNYVALEDVEAARAALEAWGYAVVELDGAAVIDRDSLLRQATVDLPGFDEVEPINWSGFDDALTGMVFEIDVPKLALVWRGAHRMLDGGLPDLMVAADVMTGVARLVYSQGAVFIIVLAGEGANFPAWPHRA
ncbi:MAG: hypothetical protein EP329_24940 [Deltaproteobacteria bacterium]|nr:MAG: hypothetical protein EP329_24940 [Deltaproteobacteria bacterium]